MRRERGERIHSELTGVRRRRERPGLLHLTASSIMAKRGSGVQGERSPELHPSSASYHFLSVAQGTWTGPGVGMGPGFGMHSKSTINESHSCEKSEIQGALRQRRMTLLYHIPPHRRFQKSTPLEQSREMCSLFLVLYQNEILEVTLGSGVVT